MTRIDINDPVIIEKLKAGVRYTAETDADGAHIVALVEQPDEEPEDDDTGLPDSYRTRGRKNPQVWWERNEGGMHTRLELSNTRFAAWVELKSHARFSLTMSQTFPLTLNDVDRLIARLEAVRAEMTKD